MNKSWKPVHPGNVFGNMQVKLDLWKARQKKLEKLHEFPKLAV